MSRRVNRIQLYGIARARTIRFEAAVAPPKSVKAHYAQNQFGSNSYPYRRWEAVSLSPSPAFPLPSLSLSSFGGGILASFARISHAAVSAYCRGKRFKRRRRRAAKDQGRWQKGEKTHKDRKRRNKKKKKKKEEEEKTTPGSGEKWKLFSGNFTWAPTAASSAGKGARARKAVQPFHPALILSYSRSFRVRFSFCFHARSVPGGDALKPGCNPGDAIK